MTILGALCGMLDLLLKPFVWMMDKTRNRRLVLMANLPRSARVLEIGGGHNLDGAPPDDQLPAPFVPVNA